MSTGSFSCLVSCQMRGAMSEILPPVLFLIFNRPDTTALVFEVIREVRPSRFYVAADGPRSDCQSEVKRCAEARRIATTIDWPCELHTLFQDTNLGCREAVSGAISWFFRHEEEGIILEDDCLPHPSFFPYCAELLNRYRSNEQIMAICGSCYIDRHTLSDVSYFFSRVFEPWGWATWRRAWRHYDCDFSDIDRFDEAGGFERVGPRSLDCAEYWRCLMGKTKKGEINTWDYQWIFTVFNYEGFVVYPTVNLISNLGFHDDATHTITRGDLPNSPLAEKTLEEINFPLNHPKAISIKTEFEIAIYKKRFGLKRRAMPGQLMDYFRSLIVAVLPDMAKGAIDYFRFPAMRESWGGPLNGQIMRQKLYKALLAMVSPVAIVETGTFRGTTTEFFAESGLPVYSMEALAYNYGFARVKLRRFKNVKVMHFDSREGLYRVLKGPLAHQLAASIFFYLDAHWNEDCPLVEELEIIFSVTKQPYVMIDDFEVPDDIGYSFDDFGGSSVLNRQYVSEHVTRYKLAVLYPKVPSCDETGARRGCIILCRNDHAERVLSTGLFRRIQTL